MTKRTPRQPGAFVLLIGLLALLLTLGQPARAADAEALIEQAKTQLQADRFLEALASAREAARAAPGDFRSHYYVGLAFLGLARFEEATSAARQALNAAPAASKPGVEKLLTVIQTRRTGSELAKAAASAASEGLMGMAAQLYEQAWNAGRSAPEFGLKAAELYETRLSQPLDAGRVLWQVLAVAAEGSPEAAAANRQVTRLVPVLRNQAIVLLDRAASQPKAQAEATIREAEQLLPDFPSVHLARLALAANDNDLPALQSAAKELARRKLASTSAFTAMPRIAHWMEQPAFASFLADLVGRTVAGEVQAHLRRVADEQLAREQARQAQVAAREQARIDRQRAYEAALVEYERELERHKLRLVQAEQGRVAHRASYEQCDQGCKKRHDGFFWTEYGKLDNCYRFCAERYGGDGPKDPSPPTRPPRPAD